MDISSDIYRQTALELYKRYFSAVGQDGLYKDTNSFIACCGLGELFAQTNDNDIYNTLLYCIQGIEKHKDYEPSSNFTLIGNSGPGLLYLSVYEITGEPELLNKAIEIGKQYYNSSSFQYNIIVKPGLSDGIAGILLFTLRLYHYSEDNFWLDLIERLTLYLVRISHSDTAGVYWGGCTNHQEINYGLQSGTAGIALVLLMVGKYFNNAFLTELAWQAYHYEHAYWTADEKPVKQEEKISILNGAAGMLLLGAFLENATDGNFQQSTNQLIGKIVPDEKVLLQYANISEWGMTLNALYNISGDGDYRERAQKLATSITNDIQEGKRAGNYKDDWSTAYFMTQMIPAQQNTAFLFFTIGRHRLQEIPACSIFNSNDNTLRRVYISRYFEKTMRLLTKHRHDEETGLVKMATDIPRFILCLENVIMKFHAAEFYLELTKLFHYERELLSTWFSYPDWAISNEEEIRIRYNLLQLPPEKFCQLELQHSKGIKFLNLRPEMTFPNEITRESFINFINNYGNDIYIFRLSDNDSFEAVATGFAQNILDKFYLPISVQSASEQILSFYLNQPEEVLQLLMSEYRAEDLPQLTMSIRTTISHGIRHCFMEGYLECLSPQVVNELLSPYDHKFLSPGSFI